MDTAGLLERLGDAVVSGDAAVAAERVLKQAMVGNLGLSGGDWAYVVPISFAYDDGIVSFHGGGSLKASLLEAGGHVCLAALTPPDLMRTDDPCDDNFRYESVLAFGAVELLQDAAARERALRAIVAKYHPQLQSAPFKPATFAGTLVYALRVDALTYKRNPGT